MAIVNCSHSHLCLREVLTSIHSVKALELFGPGKIYAGTRAFHLLEINYQFWQQQWLNLTFRGCQTFRLSSIWVVLGHFACNRSTFILRRYSFFLHVKILISVTSPLSLTRLLEGASCFQYVAMALQRKISSCCMSKLPSDSETGYLSLQYQLCQPVPYQAIVHCKEGT